MQRRVAREGWCDLRTYCCLNRLFELGGPDRRGMLCEHAFLRTFPYLRQSSSAKPVHHVIASGGDENLLAGRKKQSSPGQLSEMIVAPHAAASNRRTEGE